MNKKFKGKTNLDIIRCYLSGERPFTMVGYTGKKYNKRKIGDIWTDKSGIKWEQKASGPVQLNEVATLIKSNINYKCSCGQDIRFGSKLDTKFFYKTGLCYECIINYETKLRVLGIYPVYEQYKMISNEIGELSDIKQKLEEGIKYFSDISSSEFQLLCNSEGYIERWRGISYDDILKTTKTDLELVTERITNLIIKQQELKTQYVDSANNYKLPVYV